MNAVEWLLRSPEPAIRYRARTWLLGHPESDALVRADRAALLHGHIVAALLDFPEPPTTPYRKWWGLHWRLVSLADFDLPLDEQPGIEQVLRGAVERELDWIANPRHLESVKRLDGLYRADASMEGNALYSAARFGHAADQRARRLVLKLLEWQWPDGGWNCDRRSSGYRSSFHESWATAMGLAVWRDAMGAGETLAAQADAAARRTAELLLEHRLFRTLDGHRNIHSSMAALHWPAYWHYDFLAGLRVLAAVDPGLLGDGRAAPALDLLESKQLPDGRFETGHAWWQAGRHVTSPVDVIDWGRGRPSETLTLHALRVLTRAGRPLPPPTPDQARGRQLLPSSAKGEGRATRLVTAPHPGRQWGGRASPGGGSAGW